MSIMMSKTLLGAKEHGIVNWVIEDGKFGLLGPIGEVKKSPKYHILGFMNNYKMQREKYLRTRPKIPL